MKEIWFQQKGKIIDLRLDERAGEQDKKVSGQKTVQNKRGDWGDCQKLF